MLPGGWLRRLAGCLLLSVRAMGLQGGERFGEAVWAGCAGAGGGRMSGLAVLGGPRCWLCVRACGGKWVGGGGGRLDLSRGPTLSLPAGVARTPVCATPAIFTSSPVWHALQHGGKNVCPLLQPQVMLPGGGWRVVGGVLAEF